MNKADDVGDEAVFSKNATRIIACGDSYFSTIKQNAFVSCFLLIG
jgi:hypothetical protein